MLRSEALERNRRSKGRLCPDIAGYAELLALPAPEQAADAIALMAMKERIANKRPCPCGDGHCLGADRFNNTIRQLRSKFSRRIIKELHEQVQNN